MIKGRSGDPGTAFFVSLAKTTPTLQDLGILWVP